MAMVWCTVVTPNSMKLINNHDDVPTTTRLQACVEGVHHGGWSDTPAS